MKSRLEQDRPRILVIEPNETLRKIRTQVIASHGYQPYPALRIPEAISRCKPGAYFAVVLRGETEEVTSQLCEKIRELNPDQLIFVIETAPSSMDTKCPTRTVSGYDPIGLVSAIHEALEDSKTL